MVFRMILPARTAIEMQNLLSIFSLGHDAPGKAPVELVSLSCAEVPSSSVASAWRYSTLKNVWIFSVIEPIRKLVQVERQILSADIVVCPNNAPFQKAPERINIVGVDFAMHIFACSVAHFLVAITQFAKIVVSNPLIRCYQTNFIANSFGDELIQCPFACAFDDSADYIALTGDCSNDANLCTATPNMASLVPVAVFVFAADECFVDLDNTHKFLEVWVHHSGTEPMAHVPCGLMCCTDLPRDLERTDPFLAVEHLPEHFKPCFEVNVRILEDSAHCDGETIGRPLRGCAGLADPMPRTRFELVDFLVTAARALDAFRPATLHQELLAGIIIWKGFHQIFECHHNGDEIARIECGVKS